MYGTEELAVWARSLRYFRFTHAIGGHANDGDTLSLLLAYTDQADLIALLHALHISPLVFTAEPPGPYRIVLIAARRWPHFLTVYPAHAGSSSPATKWWAASGSTSGAACSVATLPLNLAASGRLCGWPEDVRSALTLEARSPLAERIIDPPVDSPRCLCPRYHPEIWVRP